MNGNGTITAAAESLAAPFPAFGGKRAVAAEVWRRLGDDVRRYIEPFCYSAAVLLARPRGWEQSLETINDRNAYVANFWRAVAADPDAVLDHVDWPVNETDLHTRHAWLVRSERAARALERVREDPEFFDARIAGWWCWGLCSWIGSRWCDERGRPRPKRPHLSHAGQGVNGVRGPDARARKRAWLDALSLRLRDVRVCCGHWSRACDSDSTLTSSGGTAAVFLDPPYRVTLADGRANRHADLYASDRTQDIDALCDEVEDWCLRWGRNPQVRVALCGLDGEYPRVEAAGWSVFVWESRCGYANMGGTKKGNASRERIWFSPHCLKPRPGLFEV